MKNISQALHALNVRDQGLFLWRLDLQQVTLDDCLTALSPDEKLRLQSFRQPEDALRFAATRATLRHLLADVLGCSAQALRFRLGKHGKPELIGHTGIWFNVAHCGIHSVLAISHIGAVGVDTALMQASTMTDSAAVAFSQSEFKHWRAQPADNRQLDFYQRWCGKEAVLKALGLGIGEHLQHFSLWPSSHGYALECESHEFPDADLILRHLPMPANYCAAYAIIPNTMRHCGAASC